MLSGGLFFTRQFLWAVGIKVRQGGSGVAADMSCGSAAATCGSTSGSVRF